MFYELGGSLGMEVLSLDKKEECFSIEGGKGFTFKKQHMFCVNSCKPNWFFNWELKQLQAKLVFRL
jgi:hypothetical protein